MSSLKLTLVISATAVIAAIAGYAIAEARLSSLSTFIFNSSYLSATSNASLDVKVLRAIHANDLPKATSLLETRVDMNLLFVATYQDVIPPRLRDASIYKDLAFIKAYRAEVPSSNGSVEVQTTINRVLEMRPQEDETK